MIQDQNIWVHMYIPDDPGESVCCDDRHSNHPQGVAAGPLETNVSHQPQTTARLPGH